MAHQSDRSRLRSQPAGGTGEARKRKEHSPNARSDFNKRTKVDHRAKQRDARILSSQMSFEAFQNCELDVDKFVKARQYEIRALEEGMARSKKALNKRAFQQVPKELRRRTASHNVKRAPKRLRNQAKREMAEDNTPTVTFRRRKPTRHMRLRIETAKRLRALGIQRRKDKQNNSNGQDLSKIAKTEQPCAPAESAAIKTRSPKVKQVSLATPPIPKARFRKRQINKTWLPTHMFHAKRARMTAPKEPLWRFAIPLTPTAKSYRPTHRAVNERGAVAWDMSYVSTVGLMGQQRSIEGLLKALGIGDPYLGSKEDKWRHGTRVWEGFLYQREAPQSPIAPVTVIWCVPSSVADGRRDEDPTKWKRSVFLRVHPSAFHQLWEETSKLSKIAKPQVSVEDLRYEIGSIEIMGPGATEALSGAMWPSPPKKDGPATNLIVQETWKALKTLANPGALPSNVLFGFEVQDPRLHHPPRTISLASSAKDQNDLIELLATWPLDIQQSSPSIFNRPARLAVSSALSSQKAINRRKSLAAPGEYPEPLSNDPRIPALFYCLTSPGRGQTSWTVLLPWKCVQPVWYSIMYYPLSTGGQPRFGGLEELRQVAFETGQPWFPGDYPGTAAGWSWETAERKKRKAEWERRPKSKRVNWDAVGLGGRRKGEIGDGWACDWERLLAGPPKPENKADDITVSPRTGMEHDEHHEPEVARPSIVIMQIRVAQAQSMLRSSATSAECPWPGRSVCAVRIKLLTRGILHACARIYRLPADPKSSDLREQWLKLHPKNNTGSRQKGPQTGHPRLPRDTPAHVARQRLAAWVLDPPRAGEVEYPICPGEDDLIGFVTNGSYNLAEGQGTGIGNILPSRTVEAVKSEPEKGRLCIVRNAGYGVGRLAMWEFA